MKRINILAATCLLGMGMLTGCSDFLDQQNPSAASSDNYWNNQSEAEAMLVGCYSVLQEQGMFYNYYNSCDPRALDLFGTEDGDSGWWFWSPADNDLCWGGLSASSDLPKTIWNVCYKGIARCNEVIYNLPLMGTDKIAASEAARIIGEATFLRAFYYNYLTTLFRDVPLSVEPTPTGYVQISRKADVVKYITEDLANVIASNSLPKTVDASQRGRATLGAAWALLAKIYLYNEMWSEAAAAAQKVIDLHVYELEDDYLTLFSEAGNTSKEIIFSVRFNATADGTDNKMRGFLSCRNNEEYLSIFSVTKSLLEEYTDINGKPIGQSDFSADDLLVNENRDPRWGYCFTGIKSEWKSDNWIDWYQVVTGKVNKYQDYTVAEKDADNQDYYVIRYADVLLMRAEALAQSGGSDTEIKGLVNQVRDRQSVQMPHVSDDEVAYYGGLMGLIKHERRVELALEGHHYFDLRRWHEYDKLKEFNYVGQSKVTVWPIPQSELDNNKALVQAAEWGGK